MTETPLTPAQVEVVKELLAERQARWLTQVEGLIAEAVAPLQVQLDEQRAQVEALVEQVATLQEAVGVLDGAALKLGVPLALRAASGLLVCAEEGGPEVDGDPFTFIARSVVGAWESFTPERGSAG